MMTEGYLTYSDNFVMDLNIKSLYCTLEMNVNYNKKNAAID